MQVSEYRIDKYKVTASCFAEFLNRHPRDAGEYTGSISNAAGGNSAPDARAHSVLRRSDSSSHRGGRFRVTPGFEDYPANNVTWFGADAYCRAQGKRLPTEAEWEKAARGTDGREYPWGNEAPDPSRARYDRSWERDGLHALLPVNALPLSSSPFGVIQISGNVWEWVGDWYDEKYYAAAPERDPQGPRAGDQKILRGGSAVGNETFLVTSARNPHGPKAVSSAIGFRCAR